MFFKSPFQNMLTKTTCTYMYFRWDYFVNCRRAKNWIAGIIYMYIIYMAVGSILVSSDIKSWQHFLSISVKWLLLNCVTDLE